MPEMFYPEALIPGMREVGRVGDSWGNIYPRSGWVTQAHDYKASATIVQRVDIVTRTAQPHIYFPAAKKVVLENGHQDLSKKDKPEHINGKCFILKCQIPALFFQMGANRHLFLSDFKSR